jgi:hypothetical protein
MRKLPVRPVYLVLGLVIVGLALAVALRSRDRVRYRLPQPAAVKMDDMTKITVERFAGAVELEKREGIWRIVPEGYKADAAVVSPMVNALANLELLALVSESSSYARYELDEGSRMKITAYVGSVVAREVEVGKEDTGGRTSYVKLPGDIRVYTTRQNLRELFDKEKDKLRDMAVLTFAAGGAVQVTVRRGAEALTLDRVTETVEDRETTLWRSTAGVAWDQDRVDRLLRTLASLRAQRYGESGEEIGPERLSVFVKTEDGTGHTFAAHDKVESSYAALSSQSDYPFYVAQYQYDDVAEIFEPPAAETD